MFITLLQYPEDIVKKWRECVEGTCLGDFVYTGFAPVYREYRINVTILNVSDRVKTIVVMISSVVEALRAGKKPVILINEFEQHLKASSLYRLSTSFLRVFLATGTTVAITVALAVTCSTSLVAALARSLTNSISSILKLSTLLNRFITFANPFPEPPSSL